MQQQQQEQQQQQQQQQKARMQQRKETGLWRGIKLDGFPVANIPVVCPMDGCLNVVWRDELVPHVLNEHVSLDGQRNQQWRRRGKPLLMEFIDVLSDVKGRKDDRDYEMKAETEVSRACPA